MKNAETKLPELLSSIGLDLSPDQAGRLIRFLELLLDANQTVNLTAITDFDEALIKHVYDSLTIMTLPEFQIAGTIIDIGSGGGIPVIPLAICNPGKHFVSLEATNKKLNFQIEAARFLKLINFTPIWGRAEAVAKEAKHREAYDLAIARAVAPLNILAELTIPFVKVGGNAIYYKGKDASAELMQGTDAAHILGAEFEGSESFQLPSGTGSRTLIKFRKKTVTPSLYPRKPGIPQKKPL
ncbi:MAG: 16S rRNA (guanine(527)-N(7))-methyltransferase RsmG [Firmicutes bacterium]|nr:16S rRNA (guanine(527)-N(7))-methyltransferase RsmG [Bacillota bacterium]